MVALLSTVCFARSTRMLSLVPELDATSCGSLFHSRCTPDTIPIPIRSLKECPNESQAPDSLADHNAPGSGSLARAGCLRVQGPVPAAFAPGAGRGGSHHPP